MNNVEEIIRSRELSIFCAIENSSENFSAVLFAKIFPCIKQYGFKVTRKHSVLIVPVRGLSSDSISPKTNINVYGLETEVIFVNSINYNQSAFMLIIGFDRNFLEVSNCKHLVVCDISQNEALRSDAFIRFYNNEICPHISDLDITLSLVSIYGYKKGLSTDIETKIDYDSTYYSLRIRQSEMHFLSVEKYFTEGNVIDICSQEKNYCNTYKHICQRDVSKISFIGDLDLLREYLRILLENVRQSNSLQSYYNNLQYVLSNLQLDKSFVFNSLFPEGVARYKNWFVDAFKDKFIEDHELDALTKLIMDDINQLIKIR